ncbi:MAG: DNA-deoxyinosine glycosylase [Planctomycetes bacterium]|nr:DNA-deoxyinosine glycosylase [Planctomycetota bacterium]
MGIRIPRERQRSSEAKAPRGANSERIEGLAPSIDSDCRVLVVGSMPSRRSLAVQEYYGHPQNRFWPFVEQLFGIARTLPHDERLARLRSQRVALWDVARSCERETSADSDMRAVEPNDFVALLRENEQIERVFCNGSKAFDLWRRLVVPRLESELGRDVPRVRLPSTSPANASQSVEDKLAAWRAVVGAVANLANQ